MPEVGAGGWLEPGGTWSLFQADLIPFVAILEAVL